MFDGDVINVPTTHVGLAYNPAVYRILTRFLAQNNEPTLADSSL